jgi:uncharacterized protein
MTRLCTRCQKPYDSPDQQLPNAARTYAPFCSKRCSDVDLVHWLQGDYVIGGDGALRTHEDEDGDDVLRSSLPDENDEI